MKNNKERYKQIIDEVFKKYADSHWTPPENPDGPLLSGKLWSLKPMQHSKETFINECKTDKEFSERWGLKVEEQELSHDERIILMNKKLGVTDTLPQYYNTDDEMDKNNVPTKVITVTYNNETIEFHE
jgi:hypothetical protein